VDDPGPGLLGPVAYLDIDGTLAPTTGAKKAEDVPSSVELRWRPDDHQAAFSV
jgi:hypothetical protein